MERERGERGRRVGEILAGGRASGGRSRALWKVVGGLLVIGGIAFGVRESGIVARALGAVKDLDAVASTVVEEWERARIGGLTDLHQFEGREEFRLQLETIATRRGWARGFPEVEAPEARVTAGTKKAPEEGIILLPFGAGEQAAMSWRFDAEEGRWFMTGFRITPPPLDPRVGAFRAAWAESRTDALSPFFSEESGAELVGQIQAEAREGGWGARFPTLGAGVLGEGESTFRFSDGELLVRWAYRPADDEWFVTSIGFP